MYSMQSVRFQSKRTWMVVLFLLLPLRLWSGKDGLYWKSRPPSFYFSLLPPCYKVAYDLVSCIKYNAKGKREKERTERGVRLDNGVPPTSPVGSFTLFGCWWIFPSWAEPIGSSQLNRERERETDRPSDRSRERERHTHAHASRWKPRLKPSSERTLHSWKLSFRLLPRSGGHHCRKGEELCLLSNRPLFVNR